MTYITRESLSKDILHRKELFCQIQSSLQTCKNILAALSDIFRKLAEIGHFAGKGFQLFNYLVSFFYSSIFYSIDKKCIKNFVSFTSVLLLFSSLAPPLLM